MKTRKTRHEHFFRRHKNVEELAKLSDKLTPPEEQNAKSDIDPIYRKEDGNVSDTGPLKVPPGFMEIEEEKRGIFGFEPVIVVILILMLAFITFIAYLVYLTPSK